MAEVIPDDAAEAFRRVKIGYGFEPRGSDIEALRAAAPLIVAAWCEKEAERYPADIFTAEGKTSDGIGGTAIRLYLLGAVRRLKEEASRG